MLNLDNISHMPRLYILQSRDKGRLGVKNSFIFTYIVTSHISQSNRITMLSLTPTGKTDIPDK